jgi:hypothetical protein
MKAFLYGFFHFVVMLIFVALSCITHDLVTLVGTSYNLRNSIIMDIPPNNGTLADFPIIYRDIDNVSLSVIGMTANGTGPKLDALYGKLNNPSSLVFNNNKI